MTRIAFLDHAYPEAWDQLPHATHDEWFLQCFGTSNFWSEALTAAGHPSFTLVMNAFGHDKTAMMSTAQAQSPDVVCAMEVGRFPAPMLRYSFPREKLIAFCSHQAEPAALRGYDVVFSSFKWMPEYCRSIGVRCEYLPLAFGRPVLDRIGPLPTERDIPVCFIGGLGYRTWDHGTKTMAAIAEAVPEFRWWGYCQGALSELPVALQAAHQGPAYGAEMYRLLLRTKVLINRHGEICKGWANNCRAYEGPGCGCLTLNDFPGEVSGAPVYCSAEAAVEWIRAFQFNPVGHLGMSHPFDIDFTAKKIQADVLANHTFEARVPEFLRVIESL